MWVLAEEVPRLLEVLEHHNLAVEEGIVVVAEFHCMLGTTVELGAAG